MSLENFPTPEADNSVESLITTLLAELGINENEASKPELTKEYRRSLEEQAESFKDSRAYHRAQVGVMIAMVGACFLQGEIDRAFNELDDAITDAEQKGFEDIVEKLRAIGRAIEDSQY